MNKERRAFEELKSDENIIIIIADSTVVMEKLTTITRFKKSCKVRTSIYQSAIRGAIQHQEQSLSYRKHSWTSRNLEASRKQTTGSSASPTPHQHRFTVYLRFTN